MTTKQDTFADLAKAIGLSDGAVEKYTAIDRAHADLDKRLARLERRAEARGPGRERPNDPARVSSGRRRSERPRHPVPVRNDVVDVPEEDVEPLLHEGGFTIAPAPTLEPAVAAALETIKSALRDKPSLLGHVVADAHLAVKS